jgi:septum formation protein
MIILASQSQTRQTLLRAAGVPFTAVSSGFDEEQFISQQPKPDPATLSLTLARHKAEAVSGQQPEALVVGADQTLGFKAAVYQKPKSRAEAKQQLQTLRGNTHQLHTSCVTYRAAAELWSTTVTCTLAMRNFSESWLDTYLDQCGDDILSSVGAYHIEALGLQCFEHVDGDHFAILGLPMLQLLIHLRQQGEMPS